MVARGAGLTLGTIEYDYEVMISNPNIEFL